MVVCCNIPNWLRFKIKVPANLVPGESSLSGLQIDAFLLCATHMAHLPCIQSMTEREDREHKISSGVSSFYKDISFIGSGLQPDGPI